MRLRHQALYCSSATSVHAASATIKMPVATAHNQRGAIGRVAQRRRRYEQPEAQNALGPLLPGTRREDRTERSGDQRYPNDDRIHMGAVSP